LPFFWNLAFFTAPAIYTSFCSKVQASGLHAFDDTTQAFDRLIGRGLFTAARISKGYIIAEFIGDIISKEEHDRNADELLENIRLIRSQKKIFHDVIDFSLEED
jgi:hypothetical protein